MSFIVHSSTQTARNSALDIAAEFKKNRKKKVTTRNIKILNS